MILKTRNSTKHNIPATHIVLSFLQTSNLKCNQNVMETTVVNPINSYLHYVWQKTKSGTDLCQSHKTIKEAISCIISSAGSQSQ
jgi:hypothetical protein